MKLQRFFIDSKAIRSKDIILDDKDMISQIKNVLRFRVGDKVIFLDNSGKEYESEIRELNPESLKAEVLSATDNKNEPELKITLYQSLCKKDKFEWILQKGTEVGISEFVPVITERTEKLGLNRERAEKILREAAEQSERGIIPKLAEVMPLFSVIPNLPDRQAGLIRDPGSNLDPGLPAGRQAQGRMTKLSHLSPKNIEAILLDKSGEPINKFNLKLITNNLKLFVGPEGGFTEQELKMAEENGVKIVSLGSRVLRTETAGLVAAAILLAR